MSLLLPSRKAEQLRWVSGISRFVACVTAFIKTDIAVAQLTQEPMLNQLSSRMFNCAPDRTGLISRSVRGPL